MHRKIMVAALAAAALGACSSKQEPQPAQTDAALAEAAQSAAAPSPVTEPSADASSAEAEKSIPQAMRGRWGLVAADCTPGRADAKGLMTIDAMSIRFYESVAKLSKVDQRSETALKAGYAFSGEGMDWKRDMTLALQPGGKVLIKQEFGSDAPPGPYQYKRCG